VPAWSAYCNYWKDCHPNLKVTKPTKGICNYCYVFANRHKHQTNDSCEASDPDAEGIKAAAPIGIDNEIEEVANGSNNNTATDLNADVAPANEAGLALETDI
jgi:hypothetical protein